MYLILGFLAKNILFKISRERYLKVKDLINRYARNVTCERIDPSLKYLLHMCFVIVYCLCKIDDNVIINNFLCLIISHISCYVFCLFI